MPKKPKPRSRKSKRSQSLGRTVAAPPQAGNAVQSRPPRSLRAFIGLTLLFLGPAFALWYAFGSLQLAPVAWLADLILSWFYPRMIEAVELQGQDLDIVTRFMYTPPGVELPAGTVAQYIISLNGLKYGYGFPLLLALICASPGRMLRKLGLLLLGFILIVLIQVWGISFEALIGLIFKSEQIIAQQMGSTALSREFIALGYQLGYLILPAVTPLIYWGLTHYAFLQTLLNP